MVPILIEPFQSQEHKMLQLKDVKRNFMWVYKVSICLNVAYKEVLMMFC